MSRWDALALTMAPDVRLIGRTPSQSGDTLPLRSTPPGTSVPRRRWANRIRRGSGRRRSEGERTMSEHSPADLRAVRPAALWVLANTWRGELFSRIRELHWTPSHPDPQQLLRAHDPPRPRRRPPTPLPNSH